MDIICIKRKNPRSVCWMGVPVAGEAGIEPAYHGVKVRCLTAWLLPITWLGRQGFHLPSGLNTR